jgi:ATP-dependent helicase HrpB
MPTSGSRPESPGGPLSTLPVEATIEELRSALRQTSSAVLQAPPGAGKTTIVPLRLLNEPWLDGRRIVMLEPRRLATRAAARRMADLLGEEVGRTVGYRTRDERHVGRDTRIEVVTEGILTRSLQRDPSLPGTGLVIFDEIHERNLQADLALALTLDARDALRPDLRILAMSATLDTGRVAGVIGSDEPASVITSQGRTHPVDVRWRPPENSGGRPPRMAEATAAAVQHALQHDEGDVLVFLAGAADIRRVESLLGGRGRPDDVDVRLLFGALSLQEQDLALAPSPTGRRRVVLATDIAETSLTVEGVRVVIDSGQVRSPHYDSRSGLTRLRTGANSRASADQRAGRAGRTEPGVAYRLWSKMEQTTRRPHADPEIASVDLTGLALELAVWGTSADDLTFLDPPPRRSLDDARSLLHDLGALGADGRVTDAGRAMSELPVHPRLARMITAGADLGFGAIACSLAAMLEERDVLSGRPDELPTDIVDRLRLIDGTVQDHPRIDRSALHLVRRRARELARRAGIERRDRGSTDPTTAAGLVLALAYPDRVAQARGNRRFRMRHGAGAWLPEGDALTAETFLVVAELATNAKAERARADHRILLAAAIDESDLELVAGDDFERVTTLAWDPERDDLRVCAERRLGALVLASSEGPAQPGDATVAALLDRVRATRLAVLGWSCSSRVLQARLQYAHRAFGDSWPDVSDDGLLAALDEWLAPRLHNVTRRSQLERLDVGQLLRDLVGHHRIHQLDAVVPTTFTLANGRRVSVDYGGEQPTIAVRVQDLYGTTTHPSVADGKIPLVLQLLSPADRPVQITADLPGFWAGSWSEVRKDMAGRYPKHDWPLDPTSATPRSGTSDRGRRRPS